MTKIDNYENVLNYKYKTKEVRQVEKNNIHLKQLPFSFWDAIVYDTEQYPQGLCLTEEYVFVTSYAARKNTLGKCMVFDRKSGECVVTLGMDKYSHLGGIAFDGENIWICNSSKMAIERIPYAFIQHAVAHNKGELVNVTNIVELYHVKNIPSGITFDNGILYVVTHTKWTDSKMISYIYDKESDYLQMEFIYKIPSKVQGIAFDEKGHVYLSLSYGRRNSSYLKKYRSIYSMTKDTEDYVEQIEMPPCSEGISISKDKIYVLFESAGKKYLEGTDGNGKSLSPLDKILIIDLT